jgi:hypothetical protein
MNKKGGRGSNLKIKKRYLQNAGEGLGIPAVHVEYHAADFQRAQVREVAIRAVNGCEAPRVVGLRDVIGQRQDGGQQRLAVSAIKRVCQNFDCFSKIASPFGPYQCNQRVPYLTKLMSPLTNETSGPGLSSPEPSTRREMTALTGSALAPDLK